MRRVRITALIGKLAAAALLYAAVGAVSAADLVTTTVEADKTSAKAGEIVTFTVTLKNNDTNKPITITCSTTYQDPSTGQQVTVTSNVLELVRLGWKMIAPVLKIPANPALTIIANSFTVDGSPVAATVSDTEATVTVPDLEAGQSRVVKWQATVK
ncbi:MAG: hypothetical protein ACP5R4_06900 [Armatimonadota bacterium]